jgi:hypothetical protein
VSRPATLPPALRERLDRALAERAPAGDDAAAWLEAFGAELAAPLVELPVADLQRALDALVAVGSPAREALERADALAPDRERKKRVRRAIHQLRSRGVDVTPQAAPRTSVLRPLPEARARAVVSAIDPSGTRIVWLVAERAGGSDLSEVLVSDEAGVLRIERLSGRRRDVERYVADLLASRKLEAAEVEPDAARAWLRHCERARTGALPAEVDPALVREATRGAESPTPGEHARAHTAPLASLAEAETWLRARLEAGALAPWLPSGPAIEEAAARLDEIERSPLVLSGLSERDRREQPLTTAAEAVLGPETRARLSRRLDETAALLEARGERTGAAACLRVSDAVREARDPLRVGFLRRLLELSIEGARRRRGGSGESPVIVPR